MTDVKWVLAFDLACSSCREVSAAAKRAGGERLEVAPLGRSDVQTWQRLSGRGADEREPLLFRVDGANVRAWGRAGMIGPLVGRLGIRTTSALLRALGEVRHQARVPLPAPGEGVRRKDFLRIGGGLALTGTIVLLGRTPALAEQTRNTAEAWAERNADRLPTHYDAVVGYPLAYRRAIYKVSSPGVRSRLWLEQFDRFERSNPLSAAESQVVQQARNLARRIAHGVDARDPDHRGKLEELQRRSVDVLGSSRASRLLTVLGDAPLPESPESPASDCSCTTASDWCPPLEGSCRAINCDATPAYCTCTWDCCCGTLYSYGCNGYCTG